MCDSNVYAMRKGKEFLVFESASSIRLDGRRLIMQNNMGETKTLHAAIKQILLDQHKIVVEEASERK